MTEEQKPFSLEEYNKRLEEIGKSFIACQASKMLFQKNAFLDTLLYGIGPFKPLTRWQKFKNRLHDYRQRARDIWTILHGKDIHEDCGY